jgi:hypothetical protein
LGGNHDGLRSGHDMQIKTKRVRIDSAPAYSRNRMPASCTKSHAKIRYVSSVPAATPSQTEGDFATISAGTNTSMVTPFLVWGFGIFIIISDWTFQAGDVSQQMHTHTPHTSM